LNSSTFRFKKLFSFFLVFFLPKQGPASALFLFSRFCLLVVFVSLCVLVVAVASILRIHLEQKEFKHHVFYSYKSIIASMYYRYGFCHFKKCNTSASIIYTSKFSYYNCVIILLTQVINDNYCDSADGSDEPNTSACAGVSKAPAFYCSGSGFLNVTIPLSRVQDGVCDCCDGEDEAGSPFFGVETTPCPQRCADQLLELKTETLAAYKHISGM
jgi:hypothetical protein